MAPLIVLLFSFGFLWVINRFFLKGRLTVSFIGRASLALMLLMTGMAHFFKTDPMVQSMPEFLPYKTGLVYATGVLELLGAIGLLLPATARISAMALILFFIVVLPANIIGSIKHVELGGMENGPVYLFFRIPLQVLFIVWAWYFGIRKPMLC